MQRSRSPILKSEIDGLDDGIRALDKEVASTAALGGIAGTGIDLVQPTPPPPPQVNLAYKTKDEESSGVIEETLLMHGLLERH